MRLHDTLKLQAAADSISPGSIVVPEVKKVEADSSPSDLASHHLWQEPSSTDLEQRRWRIKRRLVEQVKGRNVDPIEEKAIMGRKSCCFKKS